MKSIFYFLILLFLISCNINEKYESPKQIIIAGKILNSKLDKSEITIFANRLGFEAQNLTTVLDTLGNFHVTFESYIPTDVAIRHNTFFYILANPGDSIYIELDAKSINEENFFEHIKLSGTLIKTNQDVLKFQQMYFSNPQYADWNAKIKAIKELDSTQYLNYLDTTQQKLENIYNDFIESVSPKKQAAQWVKFYIEQEYYNSLFLYPFLHAEANGQKLDTYRVPKGYFDTILKCLPINRSSYLYGHVLSSFVENYNSYIYESCWSEKENQKYKNGRHTTGPAEIMDSIDVYSIIKYTPDTLLRQIVLTHKFSTDFSEFSEVESFDKYKNIVEKYIKEPFLREPLYKEYYQLKERLTNPQVASNTLLNGVTNLSMKQLLESIKFANQGKVIYVDCWATWCGPCKAEMPNSKELMEKMKGKDVAFVFLCLDSQEKIWKENLAKLQVGGLHYNLSQDQSSDIRKAFGISGIPFYILFDKKGIIEDKGSHLRPSFVKEKIDELLKDKKTSSNNI